MIHALMVITKKRQMNTKILGFKTNKDLKNNGFHSKFCIIKQKSDK
jgi:hypothetical protein